MIACLRQSPRTSDYDGGGEGTAAMRDDAAFAPAALNPARLLRQSEEGVEGAAGFEGADALEVFALEPEAEDWFCGGLAGPGGGGEGGGGARGGGEKGEVGGGQDGGVVDVGRDEGVGGEDGGAG